jgi:hypothetical protein
MLIGCAETGEWITVSRDGRCHLPSPAGATGTCFDGACQCPAYAPTAPACQAYGACTSSSGWKLLNTDLADCFIEPSSWGTCFSGTCTVPPLLIGSEQCGAPGTIFCGPDPTLLFAGGFAQRAGDSLVVTIGWTGSAQIKSLHDDSGATFAPLGPTRRGLRGGLVTYAATGVGALAANGLAVDLQGSPPEAFAWLWRLPSTVGKLRTETGTIGFAQEVVPFQIGGDSVLRLALVSCLGCPSLTFDTSGLVVSGSVSVSLGTSIESQKFLALEPSPAGELRLRSPTATSSWIVDTVVFGP